MVKLRKLIKNEHFVFVLLIIISASIVHYMLVLEPSRLYVEHDVMGYEYSTQETFTNIILKDKEIPLWSNYVFGGTPFWAQPQVPLMPHMVFISLIFHNNISKAINYNMLINIILGGVLIYYLLLRLKVKPRFAFISSLVFMFCGQGMILTYSWFTKHATYQWTPIIFLFFYLAFNEKTTTKNYILYAVLAGLFTALQFMAGGLDYALFMFFLLMIIPIVYLIGNNFKGRLIKTIIILIIFSSFYLGMFAIKVLPMVEFGTFSSKEAGFSLEDMIGQHIVINNISDFFKIFVNRHLLTYSVATNIGIIVSVLLLFSLFKIKKRLVITLWLIFILIFFISIGYKPLLYVFWKYFPALSKTHHVARAFYLLQFSVAVLAGIGASVLFQKIGKYIKNAKVINLLYILIVIGIIVELGFVENVIAEKKGPSSWGKSDFNEQLMENKLMNYLAKEKQEEGIFRINHFSHNMICGIAQNHVVHHELEMLYGCYSVWIPEYFNVYLAVSYSDPAKFKGMLNTKYFFDETLLNVSGIKLIKEFEPCEICYQNEMDKGAIDGPYLYENEEFLPRAYFANKGILITGSKDNIVQVTYWLMLNPHFNPVDTVIVMGGSLNDVNLNELLRYKAVILTQEEINSGTAYNLQRFSNEGGKIYPDILNNENEINMTKLELMLDSFRKDYPGVKEANISYYSANKRVIELNGEKGFLVLAEKFFMLEGWNPRIDGQTKNIMRANGINSAVYLDGEKGKLVFKYSPKSFRYGLIISSFTLLTAIIYIFYVKRSKNDDNPGKSQ